MTKHKPECAVIGCKLHCAGSGIFCASHVRMFGAIVTVGKHQYTLGECRDEQNKIVGYVEVSRVISHD
jgi:hypothetical protein